MSYTRQQFLFLIRFYPSFLLGESRVSRNKNTVGQWSGDVAAAWANGEGPYEHRAGSHLLLNTGSSSSSSGDTSTSGTSTSDSNDPPPYADDTPRILRVKDAKALVAQNN